MIPYQPIYNYFFGIGPEPVAMLLAFIVFGIYTYFGFKKEKLGFGAKQFSFFILILCVSALAGGRLWFFAFNFPGWRIVIDFFNPFVAGITSIGMLIGGAIGILCCMFANKKKSFWAIDFARAADVITPAAALGFFIFRLLGCFQYGDVIGKPTLVPWALFYVKTGEIKHPVALYLALSALVIFVLLKLFFGYEKTAKTRFGKRFDGEVALWFLLLYSLSTFFIEFFAYGHNGSLAAMNMYLGLSGVQWVEFGIFLFVLGNLISVYCLLDNIKIHTYKDGIKFNKKIKKFGTIGLIKYSKKNKKLITKVIKNP
jgi:prolipoprotein diacylglyceryltransferase